jgi:hypothetical protein
MKDFVREYWKISAAFAAGAFLLSFLVGLVTRNPFGVVILRALVLTVIFAALGAGIRFVIRTYLPELAAGTDAAPGGGQEDTRGSKIDITLPEERPEGPRRARSRAGSRRGAEPAPGDGADEGEVLQAEAEALDDLAEELAEELPGATGAVTGEEEGVESAAAEAELRPLGQEKGRGGRAPVDEAEGDMDSLPDISNLEVAGEPGAGPGRGETPADSMRGAVSGKDPATIARAIRTVLKRDEKG